MSEQFEDIKDYPEYDGDDYVRIKVRYKGKDIFYGFTITEELKENEGYQSILDGLFVALIKATKERMKDIDNGVSSQ